MSDNIQQVEPDKSEVSDIVSKHTTDSHLRSVNGPALKITLYDLEETGQIAAELAKCGYSFEVDSGFEIPTMITVHSKVNPDI